MREAWDIFSGAELFDFFGKLVEPRLALDEPVEVNSEDSASDAEEDSTDECVRQAIAESRRDPEQQAQLAGQMAGAGGSGPQAALPGDRLVRLDTPGMLILHS